MENLQFLRSFSHIIDVRSPREYAESHIPGALNLSVFSDDEFEKIGILYRQNSLEANLQGASIACRNIAHMLDSRRDVFSHKNKILLYCARGGSRSLSLFAVLEALKFQVTRMKGGYKAYRNIVLRELNAPIKREFLTLCGLTGCGKSELIEMAKSDENGAWSVNLEALCNHFGSSFGFMAGRQPGAKMFENMLAHELCECDAEILLIENESKKLGNLVIPKNLYAAYQSAPKIEIRAGLDSRVARIVKMYRDINDEKFRGAMLKISPYIARSTKDEILAAWENGELERVAELLLVKYYDKVYKKISCNFCVQSDDVRAAYEEICNIRDKLKARIC